GPSPAGTRPWRPRRTRARPPGPRSRPAPPAPEPPEAAPLRQPRFVRIKVDAAREDGKSTNVDVCVPYALAKFALRFVPQEARRELETQGIDISQLLEAAETMTEGKIVDVDATEPDGEGTTHITVEVI